MSVSSPAYHIPRVSVAGEENEWVKMFDPRPVGASPTLQEPLTPTNPVPEVMAAQGLSSTPGTARTLQLDLLNGLTLDTWDGVKKLHFFTFKHGELKSPFNTGVYPAPTVRVPRGVVFHGHTKGKGPPPHTIHWHGIEPTPMNDGVGHCSMEIGGYTYQWQPNFIGSYFYHCHRNTMQHFEFGLFGDLLIMPPDAYFASVVGSDWTTQTLRANVVLNGIPVGACSDGKFRTAANLLNVSNLAQFDFRTGHRVFGVGNNGDTGVGHPHSFTVAYDVEVIWVLDDRDSVWSDLAQDAFTTFPKFGAGPGINDQFNLRPGSNGFFAFNDFNPDYFFCTGVPFRGHVGDTVAPLDNPATAFGTVDGTIPPSLNSGVSGSQVAINAQKGQTILVRCLDAAYAKATITFPVPIVLIAWDGRALGVPPFGRYNSAVEIPANTPIPISTARRFDALIKAPNSVVSDVVKVEFLNTRGDDHLLTAQIPFNVT